MFARNTHIHTHRVSSGGDALNLISPAKQKGVLNLDLEKKKVRICYSSRYERLKRTFYTLEIGKVPGVMLSWD